MVSQNKQEKNQPPPQKIVFGQTQDTGALSIPAANNQQMAETLRPQSKEPLNMSSSQKIDDSIYNENAKFEKFRATDEGQQLAKQLADARNTTKTHKVQQASVKAEILKVAGEIASNKLLLQEKVAEYSKNGGDKANQNVVNISQNQTQVNVTAEMMKLSKAINDQIAQNALL